MTKLESLLQELCPDGVEYKPLKDIAVKMFRGSGIKRTDLTETGIPCVRYGEIYTTYGVWFDTCVSHTVLENNPSPKYFENGDILFAITGEKIEEIAKCTAYVGHEQCMAGGDLVVMKHNQNAKYLSYALSTTDAQQQKSKGKVKSKVVHASLADIQEIVIPVPPLPVQEEIVRILDQFTQTEKELQNKITAEIEARKKQYQVILSKIIESSSNKNVNLNEIAKFRYGFTAKAEDDGNARFIRITDIDEDGYLKTEEQKYITLSDESQSYILNQNDLLVARTGASYGKTLYMTEKYPAVYASYLIKISLDNEMVLNKYYWYFSKSEIYWKQAERLVSQGGQPQFNANVIKQIMIPICDIDKQKRVISIMDKFTENSKSLISNLTAELSARQTQYEYYRDKLLTFKARA